MSNQYIITQEEFDSLLDKNTKVKVTEKIIKKIDKRVNEILTTLKILDGENSHWKYESYERVDPWGYEVTDTWWGGEKFDCFDPKLYEENIFLAGNFNFLTHNQYIPTRWLWEEDYVEQYNMLVYLDNQAKEAEKKRLEEVELENIRIRNMNKSSIKKSILSKLTEDEILYIKRGFSIFY